ncbi:MAG: 2-phospho-L-lactate guanylyltransferase [Acidimicrobiia bacterium]
MPTTVIIPIKSFRLGKQRLAETLDDARRARLGRALAAHVAATVESASLIPLIVTADHDVADWATTSGFPSLPDPGTGLNAAAATGVEWAGEAGTRWIVLHGDLPLLNVSDVSCLGDISANGRSVIAPSADGGTSAIGGLGEFSFSFGSASFHRHLPRMDRPEVVVRAGLSLDVDSPNDLESAAASTRGRWLRDVLS